MANESEAPRSNFIRQIIDADLEAGKHDQVVTRFPPEPNGYLHIGHAKSICLNYGIKRDYAKQGLPTRFHLRFDDTNPTTEETEYVDAIKHDVAWLGADWGDHLYFASDYFERMYELAERLIAKGKAYVDSQSTEEIRAGRGKLGEPGEPSPYRDRTVAENLDLFRRMRAGEFADGTHVLRAKIDMSSPNMLMRDPLLYRIRHAHHHRTGDKWCIYPMYDYAHCLEDAFEGVTHSICTLEFENNRELYDWVIAETEVDCQPQQIEFARLNLSYTVMSKRKLRQLVEQDYVSGWDDPRMPTLAAYRRRGVTPDAIWAFTDMIGVAKANSTVDIKMLEFAIRDDLNMKAPRVMAVVDPLKVTITNWADHHAPGEIDWLEADYYPHDVPKEGSRKVPFGAELFIERDDFMVDPPDDFWRLAPGREVRLRYGYFITCDEVVTDDDGQVVELKCSYDPATRGGAAADGRNPKGTIHWVSATEGLAFEARLYDRLFIDPTPDADPNVDFTEYLNPESLVVHQGAVEPSVADDPDDTRYQFERLGYFWRDPVDSAGAAATDVGLVFNQIVPLRDSWSDREKERAKQKEREAAARKKAAKERARQTETRERPNKRPASYERDKAREDNPALAARFERYQADLELDYDNADLLSGDLAVAEFFEAAIDAYDRPQTVATWLVNELLPELEEPAGVVNLPFGGADVAELIRLFDEDRITNQVSHEVLVEMMETGRDAATIIAEGGLEKLTDASQLEPVVDQVIAEHPDEVGRYRGGLKNLLGFFIGQVMRATDGTADPKLTRQLLAEKLRAE